jgi:hypothetical protein
MASENGDYLSRFEQMQKTLQGDDPGAANSGQHSRGAAQRPAKSSRQNERIDQLATKVDDLVGAIRSLIDRIPSQSLQ